MTLVLTKNPYTRPEAEVIIVEMEQRFAESNEKIENDYREYDWD